MVDVANAASALPLGGRRRHNGRRNLASPVVKERWSRHLCPNFQAALDVLARPWNGMIMESLAFKPELRYSELREQLAAVGDRMLASRLKELEARGLIERRVSPGPPVKVAYALTELGEGFRPVAAALRAWGERVAAAPRRGRGGRGTKAG
jgi:DNA-binding HxlR family transcriptional regulator